VKTREPVAEFHQALLDKLSAGVGRGLAALVESKFLKKARAAGPTRLMRNSWMSSLKIGCGGGQPRNKEANTEQNLTS
jgi:hypothetical protein